MTVRFRWGTYLTKRPFLAYSFCAQSRFFHAVPMKEQQ